MSKHKAGQNGDFRALMSALEAYQADFPKAKVAWTAPERFGVRIRIVDPSFRGMEKSNRHTRVWKYLNRLTDEQAQDVAVLLLLTPEEGKKPLAEFAFEA